MNIIRPLQIASISSSNVTENDYAEYSAVTGYPVSTRVIVAADHKIYESLQSSNLNHTPSSSPDWWLDCGATNRWKMFDTSVTSQTSNANSIDVTFVVSGRVDSVALMNIDATSARIIMTDSVDGVVYDKTYNLMSNSGIADWCAYFREPIERKTDLIVTDLPAYGNPTLRVILSASGSIALCGACVFGQLKKIGRTQSSPNVGIQDYSVKQRDDFGNYRILERAFNKRGNFTMLIDSSQVDSIQSMLAKYRATPVVYIGSTLYSATIVFGFYKDFSIEIAYPQYSICTLEIEGLT